jgi:hypothetical protein
LSRALDFPPVTVLVVAGKTRFGAGGGEAYTFALVQGGLLGASIAIFIIGTTKGE